MVGWTVLGTRLAIRTWQHIVFRFFLYNWSKESVFFSVYCNVYLHAHHLKWLVLFSRRCQDFISVSLRVSLRWSFITVHGNKLPLHSSTCVSSSPLPACRSISHWLSSCGHRTGRFIGWPPPTRPPPPPPPPVLRQPAEREGSLSVDSGCLRLSASSHEQA